MENDVLVKEFCDKYNVDEGIVRNYIASLEVDDFQSMDIYRMLLFNDCPSVCVSDMKADLKTLLSNLQSG